MSNGPAGTTAFVLAGGGSLGAIQVGMLRALVAHGVTADFVVGSSAGAINGAYFAGDAARRDQDGYFPRREAEVISLTWFTVSASDPRRKRGRGADIYRRHLASANCRSSPWDYRTGPR